jgi:hypothetical protein
MVPECDRKIFRLPSFDFTRRCSAGEILRKSYECPSEYLFFLIGGTKLFYHYNPIGIYMYKMLNKVVNAYSD